MTAFRFPKVDAFLNRESELAEMDSWWTGNDPNALLIYGRRRVGKSWLFRRFAHEKPTVILVGERLPAGAQLRRFAAQLAPSLDGVVPQIDSVPELFRVLLSLGANDKRLVVVDELPYLLPATDAARERMLTAIQAVMEEREESRSKLVFCGSHVAVMEGLMRSGSGLSGRLRPLQVAPMGLKESRGFIEDDDQIARIERYAVAGGMARYLALLGSHGTLRDAVCQNVLNANGPLFNDPRDVLEREFKQTDNYFGLLDALSSKREMSPRDLALAVKRDETALPSFLRTLREMKLIDRKLPFGADRRSPGQYRLADPFLRFWFRYVFPFQESLGAGLTPEDLWDSQIQTTLPEHVSWTFEDLCRQWVLVQRGRVAPVVHSWWGVAGPRRQDPERGSEEIDIVGGVAKRVALVGECKWTSAPMGPGVLNTLREHKLPALRQSRLKVTDDVEVVMFSRAGFTDKLHEIAQADPSVELVDARRVVDDLLA